MIDQAGGSSTAALPQEGRKGWRFERRLAGYLWGLSPHQPLADAADNGDTAGGGVQDKWLHEEARERAQQQHIEQVNTERMCNLQQLETDLRSQIQSLGTDLTLAGKEAERDMVSQPAVRDHARQAPPAAPQRRLLLMEE